MDHGVFSFQYANFVQNFDMILLACLRQRSSSRHDHMYNSWFCPSLHLDQIFTHMSERGREILFLLLWSHFQSYEREGERTFLGWSVCLAYCLLGVTLLNQLWYEYHYIYHTHLSIYIHSCVFSEKDKERFCIGSRDVIAEERESHWERKGRERLKEAK